MIIYQVSLHKTDKFIDLSKYTNLMHLHSGAWDVVFKYDDSDIRDTLGDKFKIEYLNNSDLQVIYNYNGDRYLINRYKLSRPILYIEKCNYFNNDEDLVPLGDDEYLQVPLSNG